MGGNHEDNFLHNVNGVLEAGYALYEHGAQQLTDINFHQGIGNLEPHPQDSDLIIHNTVRRVGRRSHSYNTSQKCDPLNWDDLNYPNIGPQTYVVEMGDSLNSIARKIYGDTQAAGIFAKVNNLFSMEHKLKQGQLLRLPFYIPMRNQSQTLRPYQQFKMILIGHLSPHVITPQLPILEQDDDGSFLGEIVKVIAVAIVIAVAQELAPIILTALEITSSTAVAVTTGVLAGIGDAAVQGVAIGLGLQHKFSAAEALETGVSAGVARGLGKLGDINKIKIENIAHRALKVGTSVSMTQLIEMKAGLRNKFDAKAVALQVSSSIAASYINEGVNKITKEFGSESVTSAVSDAADTTASSLLGHAVIGAPLNVQSMAANTIGSVVGNETGNQIKTAMDSRLKQEQKNNTFKISTNKSSSKIHSSHDDALQNEIAFSKVDDPHLSFYGHRYGEASYRLSEMNRAKLNENYSHRYNHNNNNNNDHNHVQINRAQRWNNNAVSKKDWGNNKIGNEVLSDEYYAAGRRAGLDGRPAMETKILSSDKQYAYAEGYARGSSEYYTYKTMDDILLATGIYDVARMGIAFAGRVGGFIAKETSSSIVEHGIFGGKKSGEVATLSNVDRAFYSKAKLISEHDFYNPGSVPARFSDTFMASRYKTYQLSDDFIFYRGGSKAQEFGQFLSFDKPISELQVRMDKAIRPLWPDGGQSIVDTGYALKIPKNTIVHVGDVSSQSGIFLGGTKQIFIDRPWLVRGAKVIDSYSLKEELLWNQIAMKK